MTQNTASSPSAVSSASTSLPAIGVIGLGIMGGLYAQHLLAAGFTVTGYDVSAERIECFAHRSRGTRGYRGGRIEFDQRVSQRPARC
jgi:3-hydroxyacyl-CoA dehydrogenase